MKIIICGPAFSEEVVKNLHNASPAAGMFLSNLINAFNNQGVSVRKAVYITNKVKLNKENEIYKCYDEKDLVIVKDKTIFISSLNFKKRLLEMIDEETVVIFYNMCYSYFGLAKKIESRKGKSILMLADHTGIEEQSGFFRKVYTKLCENEYKKFQKVITLSNNVSIKFNNNAKKMIMPGGIKIDNYSFLVPTVSDNKLVIMYAGLLSEVTGVDTFIEAIKKCKLTNVKFKISGVGELEELVKRAAEDDDRIEYLGFMDHKQYLKELESVNIFINPRNMKLKQNQNNFPSKVLEYLATGRVIISTKFPGYKEFEKNIEFYDGGSDELTNMLEQVVENYRDIYAEKFKINIIEARKYDWNIQAKNIMNFIKK